MAGSLPHGATVLGRRTVWRPNGHAQLCEACAVRYDGPECPYCGRPAEEEAIDQLVLAFATADGRCWVAWAVRDAAGLWAAERIRSCPSLAAALGVAS
jgi:hypothetical protein